MKASFGPSRRIELLYESAIRRMFESIIPAKTAGESFEEWVARLADLSTSQHALHLASSLAEQMVRWSEVSNARSWREAARKSTHARLLYKLQQKELQGPIGQKYWAIIQQNAQLIRSIPQDVAQHLNGHLAKAQQQGLRPEAVSKMMRVQFPKLAKWKINLIARTEVAKAASAITQVKAQSIGLASFVWETSQDQRVRPSHRNLQGVVMFWDDPPSPEALIGQRSSLGHYLPGNCPNCRCGSLPMLTLDDVNWPRKVYIRGHIAMMTRAAFAERFGVPERVAA